LDWNVNYDALSTEIKTKQDYILSRYIPYLFVFIHHISACVNPGKIKFPTLKSEMFLIEQKTKNIMKSLYSDMEPLTKSFNSPQVLSCDVLFHLYKITAQNFRPVNKQLYTQMERNQLNDLVNTMISYNLTYRQEKNEDGNYVYVLEPNISEICSLVKQIENKYFGNYANKQLISKEVESEKMRRSESLLKGKNTNNNADVDDNKNTPKKKHVETKTKNHLQYRVATPPSVKKKAQLHEKPVQDFFSRFTKVKRTSEAKKKTEVTINDPGIGNSQVWFKFNEGYSNAVRKTLYIKDFV